MCGRYYLSEEAMEELAHLVKELNLTINPVSFFGDVLPKMNAPVLRRNPLDQASVSIALSNWGFHLPQDKRLVINARAETIKEKPFFSTSFHENRCIIPATGFYEWDLSRNKYQFWDPLSPLLFMAGIEKQQNNDFSFAIITTPANASMKPIHSRMPLLLTLDEAEEFLFQESLAVSHLKHIPPSLSKSTDFEQLRLDLF